MVDKLSWRSFNALAEELQKTYPKTDLLFLRNDNLVRMVKSLPVSATLPEFPESEEEANDICHGLKIAWARLASGMTVLDSVDDADAYTV